MKRIIVLVMALAVLFPVCIFAAQFHSVPIGHEAYRIIEIGEIRGIIPVQTEVKPYNLNIVRSLLAEIRDSRLTSASERIEIERVLSEFNVQYGNSSVTNFRDMLKTGYYRTDGSSSTAVGGQLSSYNTIGHSMKHRIILDSRNDINAFVRGDIANILSYDLNFMLTLDRIDIYANPKTDLQLRTDGFYSDLSELTTRLSNLPSNRFYVGILTFPELSTSFNDDLLTVRIGAVNRDWGPGLNNLGLSGSAREFDGIDLSLSPTSWFKFSVTVGSLGNVSLDSVDGVEWPSESMDDKLPENYASSGLYFNNISIHRVEVGPFYGARFSIWESVIWRKRFELSYLNPLSIYMFAQNYLGDYDNMLAGFDFSYNLPGVGQLYAAVSFDELNNGNIKSPRNMLAYQIGVKFGIPAFDFSRLTIQATYIPAFFGAHYPDKANIFGDVKYVTQYVNKGQPLSYPVNPDTFELLGAFDATIFGWSVKFSIKDQMRSAQYSIDNHGTTILNCMDYDSFDSGMYSDRDFFGNIWNNIFDVEFDAEYKFANSPITICLGLEGILESSRSFTTSNPIPTSSDGFKYNPGYSISWGEWEHDFAMTGSVGVKLYY